MFDAKQLYTRRQIHDVLGGSLQAYLPQKNNTVVCGCFGTKLNPDAPRIVLVGSGRDVYASARIFCKQKNFVPVFMKLGVNRWRYVGRYRVERWSEGALELKERNQSSGRMNVQRIMWLEKEGEAAASG